MYSSQLLIYVMNNCFPMNIFTNWYMKKGIEDNLPWIENYYWLCGIIQFSSIIGTKGTIMLKNIWSNGIIATSGPSGAKRPLSPILIICPYIVLLLYDEGKPNLTLSRAPPQKTVKLNGIRIISITLYTRTISFNEVIYSMIETKLQC